MKAKELDKVEHIKKQAELEGRIAYFTAEREVQVKDRVRLEKELAAITREKQQLFSKLEAQEAEIELYKNANEEHLDRFDAKFD
jgi:hypothetical protein